jgi:hypothetical protein
MRRHTGGQTCSHLLKTLFSQIARPKASVYHLIHALAGALAGRERPLRRNFGSLFAFPVLAAIWQIDPLI